MNSRRRKLRNKSNNNYNNNNLVNIEAAYDDTEQHYHITRVGRKAKRNPFYSFSATVLSGDPSNLQEA
jgi:hypothetical protein